MENTKPKLQFRYQSVYGKDLFYPANQLAETICKTAKRKTLTKSELKDLENGGFEVSEFQVYQYTELKG